jgi:RHS repeat-associated protein
MPDLGLLRMGVRDYDPEINRFTTPDPLFLDLALAPVACMLSHSARAATVLAGLRWLVT